MCTIGRYVHAVYYLTAQLQQDCRPATELARLQILSHSSIQTLHRRLKAASRQTRKSDCLSGLSPFDILVTEAMTAFSVFLHYRQEALRSSKLEEAQQKGEVIGWPDP